MDLGFQIRSLSFHGNGKKPATISFGPGLNVVHGASNTGKSFIIEAIDFMLGGKGPLPDIPERVGYDQVMLSVEDIASSDQFTLLRSHEGGAFKLFSGRHEEVLPTGEPLEILSDIHSNKTSSNLSAWLLSKLGATNSRIRKNKNNETVSLSFRHLARLAIINEEEIIQKRSPLADGNYTADTANFATFKLLITGSDDSGLVSTAKSTPEELSREAKIDLLDELISEHRQDLKKINGKPGELQSQEEKLDRALEAQAEQLTVTESMFKDLSVKRRSFHKRIEEGDNRLTEISTLLSRFKLLDVHYASDLTRLEGIQEAGSLFLALGSVTCPLCGADPVDHDLTAGCDGDISQTVAAASAEIKKIKNRRHDLVSTTAILRKEEAALSKKLPFIREELRLVLEEIQDVIAPNLKGQRASYSDLSDKMLTVREAIRLNESLRELEDRKAKFIAEDAKAAPSSNIGSDLPTSIVDDFAKTVELALQRWNFPNADRVYFDMKLKDLVIGGKSRIAFGKGLRAITQAAFTISLLRYCKTHNSPHPGFVVLDSPLLSYRAPDSADDDLTDTGLKEEFFGDLLRTPKEQQVIIIENVPPTSEVIEGGKIVEFTGIKEIGRPGLFPV